LASVECDLRLGARDAEAGLHHLERHPGPRDGSARGRLPDSRGL